MRPKVAIIILNWNGWKDTLECLESVYQINYSIYNVIIIDNCSQDNSIQKIKDYCNGKIIVESKFFEYCKSNKPIKIKEYTKGQVESGEEKEIKNIASNKKLILVKCDKNYGFAEGNNIGINYALENLDPDYILLLNNDTVVHRLFLTELVKVAEKEKKAGIIGPKIYYYNQANKIQVAWSKINFMKGEVFLAGDGEIDQLQYNECRETDHVPGACFLIKREVIDKVGLLNTHYFCYWEEVDYCMIAKNANYRCIYSPESMIWHKVYKSSDKITGFFEYYMTRNMFWFMKKHAKRGEYLTFLLYFFGFRLWFLISKILRSSGSMNTLKCFFKGIADGIKFNLNIPQ